MITRKSRLAALMESLGLYGPHHITVSTRVGTAWDEIILNMEDLRSVSWTREAGSGGAGLSTASIAYYSADPPSSTTVPTTVSARLNVRPLQWLFEIFGPYDAPLYGLGVTTFTGVVMDVQAKRHIVGARYDCMSALSSRKEPSTVSQSIPSDTSLDLGDLIVESNLDNRLALDRAGDPIRGARLNLDRYWPLQLRVIVDGGLTPAPSKTVSCVTDIGVWVREYHIEHQDNYDAPYQPNTDLNFMHRRLEMIAPAYREAIATSQVRAAPAIPADVVLADQSLTGRMTDQTVQRVVRTRSGPSAESPWVEWRPPGFNPFSAVAYVDLDWCLDLSLPGRRASAQVLADALHYRRIATDTQATQLRVDLALLLRRYKARERRAGWWAAYIAHLVAGDAVTLAPDVNARSAERCYIVDRVAHEITPDGWIATLDLVPASWVVGRPITAPAYAADPWEGLTWRDYAEATTWSSEIVQWRYR